MSTDGATCKTTYSILIYINGFIVMFRVSIIINTCLYRNLKLEILYVGRHLIMRNKINYFIHGATPLCVCVKKYQLMII